MNDQRYFTLIWHAVYSDVHCHPILNSDCHRKVNS